MSMPPQAPRHRIRRRISADLQNHAPAVLAEDAVFEDLRYIRRTMEEAGSFTAVPGWGMVAIGASAIGAAALAARQRSAVLWLALWMAEAVLALVIAAWTMSRKADVRSTLLQGPGRRFA